ncbi:unnamed protein product [Caenorhabditis sp. 36 PRJEB53466]|nr:unnamed protein product [Caenorhabditis sp. 36 PRJEB53466]
MLNLNKDCIVFDEPDRKFLPGDTVSGHVTFVTKSPTSARSLDISWIGFAWTRLYALTKPYNSTTYFSDQYTAWSSKDGKEKLPAGKHSFPFSFKLPKECSPSFKGQNGGIEYFVKVAMNRPRWRKNLEFKKRFPVTNEPVETRKSDAYKKTPLNFHIALGTGGYCCVSFGEVKISGSIPVAQEFGKTMHVTLTVENMSSKPVKYVNLHITQWSHYHALKTSCKWAAGHECPLSSYATSTCSAGLFKQKLKFHVAPMMKKTQEFEVELPAKRPTIFTDPLMAVTFDFRLSASNSSEGPKSFTGMGSMA